MFGGGISLGDLMKGGGMISGVGGREGGMWLRVGWEKWKVVVVE